MGDSIEISAPATVANVGPGFDILGLALENIGDEIEMFATNKLGITIEMPDSNLTTDPKMNVAGVAVQALLDHLNSDQGFHIVIRKNIAPGSGLGSSASSAAGSVYGANKLLGEPFNKTDLVKFAMIGETIASGKVHADNVAPSLLGGFTMIRSYDPLHVVNLAYPKDILVVIIHPQIEIKTSDSKKLLRKLITMEMAIKQLGNVAGLVSGLASGNLDLIGKSLEDSIAEPVRSMLIPGFDGLKEGALNQGALGCSISGSGPSVFAICASSKIASAVADTFEKIYSTLKIDFQIYISKVNDKGTQVKNGTSD